MNSIRGNITRYLSITAGLVLILSAPAVSAQGHVVVVKMVDKPNAQFGFEPTAVVAQRGDTVRFVQASSAPHNVHFDKTPKGAKLGDAQSGPYVIGDAKNYDVVIDSRFVDGTYSFICDPHQSVGMHGTLTVGAPAK